MVALLVALMFLAFFLVDHVMHRRDLETYGRVPVPVSRFSLPDAGTFVTTNHLTAVISEQGRFLVKPDAFLAEAAGGAILEPASKGTVRAGDTLYRLSIEGQRLEVAAPFSGEILAVNGDTLLFHPRDTAAAVRGLLIGETLREWWSNECRRLSRFLGETETFAVSLADGGQIASGYLQHLSPAERRRFSRIFLQRGGGH